MQHSERIDASKGIDVYKTGASKDCDLCHYWFQRYVCNGCHDLLMISVTSNNIDILKINGTNYSFNINEISKRETVNVLQSANLTEDKGVLLKNKKN